MKNIFETTLIILVIFSLLIDKQIASFIASNRILILNQFFTFIVNYISAEIILAILLIYIIFKKRKLLKPYIVSLLSYLVIVNALKYLIARPRPFIALALEKLPDISYAFSSWNASFPSGHAVVLFLMIPFIDNKYKPYWFALAIIIVLSRIYVGFHYLSDVIFGALLGYLIAKTSIKYFSKN
ncbi:phosphatase PAP2 family protein [Candidatus Woesearchaeota archaeon]|nr:phosphatase PAP2 family protein [Candidatus Woesearchaeota archaeon]